MRARWFVGFGWFSGCVVCVVDGWFVVGGLAWGSCYGCFSCFGLGDDCLRLYGGVNCVVFVLEVCDFGLVMYMVWWFGVVVCCGFWVYGGMIG